ncbi:DMT family transporter [Veillonella rodentium]|uniref:Predicted permease, DMT superfamily n=1 Tax=Veillonella rodentium TaxID=248315 RepID=A0A239ZVA8_9FIRM|nr:DMT family transporter [Veillonella rodentium]SNV75015.1 Predicted permease, DMT superfamily [Veillonella rodentium]
MSSSVKNIGLLAIFLATIFLSTKSIFAKLLYLHEITPIMILMYRAIISLPFFLVPLLKVDWKNTGIKQVMIYGVIGSFIYLSSSIADFIGLLFISASLERAILFTFPIYVFLLSKESSKITIVQIGLIFSTVIGLMFMFNPIVIGNIRDTLVGGGLVLLSAIFWAIFIIYSKHAVQMIGATAFTSAYMCISTIALVLIFMIFSKDVTPSFLLEDSVMVYLVLLALMCSIIPSYLLSYGVKVISATQTAIISALGPISTLVLDVIVLNHNITINEIIGTIIVTLSVTYLTRLYK